MSEGLGSFQRVFAEDPNFSHAVGHGILISLRDSRRGNSRLGKKTSKMSKVDIGTIENGFRASDLSPEGLKKSVARFNADCVRPVFGTLQYCIASI